MTVISKVSVKQRKKKAVNCTVFANALIKKCNDLFWDVEEPPENLSLAAEMAWRLYGRGDKTINRNEAEEFYNILVNEDHYLNHPSSRKLMVDVTNDLLI